MAWRILTPEWIAAASAPTCRPVLLYEGVFASSRLTLWTGDGDTTWDSKTWLGNGYLQNVTAPDENTDLRATGIKVVLSAVPEEVIALSLEELRLNNAGTIYLGFVEADFNTIISDPYPFFTGRLDTATVIDIPGGASTFELSYESRLVDLERQPSTRYTDECQKSFFPNDTGFRFVPRLGDWSGFWGKAAKKLTRQQTHRKRGQEDSLL